MPAVWANVTQTNIEEANSAVQDAFVAVLSVEHVGKDITALLAKLNDAASLLAEAENAYNSGNLADVASKAESAAQIAQQVKHGAENLLANSGPSLDSFWAAIAFSAVGSLVFSTGLLVIWRRFKQTSPKRALKLEKYRLIFMVVGLVGILLFTSPALSLLRSSASESFSTINLVGPDHMTNTIPSNIQLNTLYSTHLGVENHLGSTTNYICLVKLANDTDSLPDYHLGAPSTLPTLYKFNPLLQDGQAWSAPLKFKFNSVRLSSNEAVLESITLNGVDFSVSKPSQWDSDSSGYYYSILVELWAYNESTMDIQYQNRFIHFYLNLSVS